MKLFLSPIFGRFESVKPDKVPDWPIESCSLIGRAAPVNQSLDTWTQPAARSASIGWLSLPAYEPYQLGALLPNMDQKNHRTKKMTKNGQWSKFKVSKLTSASGGVEQLFYPALAGPVLRNDSLDLWPGHKLIINTSTSRASPTLEQTRPTKSSPLQIEMSPIQLFVSRSRCLPSKDTLIGGWK